MRFRRWSTITASPAPGEHATKSSSELLPLWNLVDDASTNVRSRKRPLERDARQSVGSDFVKRIAVASRSNIRTSFSSYRSKTSAGKLSARSGPVRYLDRRMRRLKVKKSDDESDSPMEEESSSDSAMQEDILLPVGKVVLDGYFVAPTPSSGQSSITLLDERVSRRLVKEYGHLRSLVMKNLERNLRPTHLTTNLVLMSQIFRIQRLLMINRRAKRTNSLRRFSCLKDLPVHPKSSSSIPHPE